MESTARKSTHPTRAMTPSLPSAHDVKRMCEEEPFLHITDLDHIRACERRRSRYIIQDIYYGIDCAIGHYIMLQEDARQPMRAFLQRTDVNGKLFDIAYILEEHMDELRQQLEALGWTIVHFSRNHEPEEEITYNGFHAKTYNDEGKFNVVVFKMIT